MKWWISYLPLLVGIISNASANNLDAFEGSLEDENAHRSPRLLLNPFGILGNTKCFSGEDEGRCYGEVECLALAGNFGQFCEGFKGLCCTFFRTCHQRTSREVAYFKNSQYPLEHQDPNDCPFKIVRRGNDYCGLRIQSEPSSEASTANCESTYLYVVGKGLGSVRPRQLCTSRRNNNLDYSINFKISEVKLIVNSTTRASAAWKIKVTQIKCGDHSGGTVDNIGTDSVSGPTPPTTTRRPTTITTTRRTTTRRTTTRRPEPSPPAPPPFATTTRRPSNTHSFRGCGIVGRSDGQSRIFGDILGDYFGVNRIRLPSEESQSSISNFPVVPLNSDGLEENNQLLKDLVYDEPADLKSSTFEYWKGPDSLITSRVTYGTNASPHSFPWQVAMFVNRRYHCGASIIGDFYLLTAAHCVISYKFNPGNLKLSIGDHKLGTQDDGKEILVKATKITVHPEYSRSTLRNDVAVIKLRDRIEYTDRVSPICLPSTDIPTDSRQITITGWGRDENKRLKTTLQKLTSNTVRNTECDRSWMKKKAPAGFITGNMLCLDSSQGDSCNGDSGGPAVLKEGGKFVQVGIVSFGSGSCTDANLPGVYTRVGKYRDWIRQQMS